MMKFLFLIILTLYFSLTALAQGVKLGGRAGLNVANISFDPDINNSNTSKSAERFFLVGGLIQIGISELFSFGIEPTYIQKGANFEETYYRYNGYPNLTVTHITRYRYSYFELPLLFKAYLPFSAVKPYAEIGMNIGFRVASSKEYEVIPPYQNSSISKVYASVNETSSYT